MTRRFRFVHRLAALFTAMVGAMDIVSALYPAAPTRMELLRDLLPVHLIRGTQTATVLVGFFLILLADGLRKRRRRALQMALALVLTSSALNITKGLDYEEAMVGLLLAFGLLFARKAFDVPSEPPVPARFAQRIATFAALYYAYLLAGFFILRQTIVPSATLWGVASEPVRLFLFTPRYHYLTAQAQWFERSLVVVSSVAVLYAVYQLLKPLLPHRPATDLDIERVRQLVRQYGTDSLSYFALQDGRSYFFDAATGQAVLSYRLWGNVALVGGDPIGPPHLVLPLLGSFLEFADANAMDVCFVGVDGTRLHMYRSLGLKALKIGEEAVVDLPTFDAQSLKRKVRRADRHVKDLGIEVKVCCQSELSPVVSAQLEEISREWVEARGGEERGFSMTLGRLPRLSDFDCRVVIATEGDFVWGYLCLAPIYQGDGWSLDAMRRRTDSPNGLVEALVIHAGEILRDQGYATLSLNFALLSNDEDDIDSRALDRTRKFLFEQLSAFYQLKSLYQFNSKFQPRWRSRYMAYRDVLKFPKLAIAVVQSEDPVRLPSLPTFFRR